MLRVYDIEGITNLHQEVIGERWKKRTPDQVQQLVHKLQYNYNNAIKEIKEQEESGEPDQFESLDRNAQWYL